MYCYWLLWKVVVVVAVVCQGRYHYYLGDVFTLALRGLEEPAHASRGLEEPFSSCAVVSVFGSGGK